MPSLLPRQDSCWTRGMVQYQVKMAALVPFLIQTDDAFRLLLHHASLQQCLVRSTCTWTILTLTNSSHIASSACTPNACFLVLDKISDQNRGCHQIEKTSGRAWAALNLNRAPALIGTSCYCVDPGYVTRPIHKGVYPPTLNHH